MAQVKEHFISRAAKTGLSLLRNQMETLATQAKKNGVMTGHLCTKATCLKYCVRVSGWWHLQAVSTACGYFFPVTISFILIKEKLNVVYFEKAQTILTVLALAKTWVFSFYSICMICNM